MMVGQVRTQYVNCNDDDNYPHITGVGTVDPSMVSKDDVLILEVKEKHIRTYNYNQQNFQHEHIDSLTRKQILRNLLEQKVQRRHQQYRQSLYEVTKSSPFKYENQTVLNDITNIHQRQLYNNNNVGKHPSNVRTDFTNFNIVHHNPIYSNQQMHELQYCIRRQYAYAAYQKQNWPQSTLSQEEKRQLIPPPNTTIPYEYNAIYALRELSSRRNTIYEQRELKENFPTTLEDALYQEQLMDTFQRLKSMAEIRKLNEEKILPNRRVNDDQHTYVPVSNLSSSITLPCNDSSSPDSGHGSMEDIFQFCNAESDNNNDGINDLTIKNIKTEEDDEDTFVNVTDLNEVGSTDIPMKPVSNTTLSVSTTHQTAPEVVLSDCKLESKANYQKCSYDSTFKSIGSEAHIKLSAEQSNRQPWMSSKMSSWKRHSDLDKHVVTEQCKKRKFSNTNLVTKETFATTSENPSTALPNLKLSISARPSLEQKAKEESVLSPTVLTIECEEELTDSKELPNGRPRKIIKMFF